MITTTQIITNDFIDIHCHIIPCVDDGSKNFETSLFYLKQAQKKGIKRIICTPHIVDCNIDRINLIKNNFLQLKDAALKYEIELYLGTEIMLTFNTLELFKKNKMRSLNGSKYILVEVKRNEKMDVEDLIYYIEELKLLGYIPILAHPELYKYYRSIDTMKRIKEMGILLQMDCTSVLRKTSSKNVYKFSKKLLKEKLIDFVASDSHCTNKRNFKSYKKAYNKIKRKYGKIYANTLFKENPSVILED